MTYVYVIFYNENNWLFEHWGAGRYSGKQKNFFVFSEKAWSVLLLRGFLFSKDEILRFYRKITEINFQQISVDNEKNGGAFYYTTAFVI